MSFHRDRPTMTVEQLADEIKVPLSTAYRYVLLLRDVGLLEAGKGGIQVSPRAIELAKAAIAANGIIQIARPVLESMRDQTGEGARLTRRLNEGAVCIDQVESGQPVRLTFEPGEPKPLYGGASSKLLLAFMPNAELKRYLERLPKLLSDKDRRKRLIDELPAIRQRGWAVSEGEIDAGVWAAAAAVSNGHHVVAAVSVAAPAYRLPKALRMSIIKTVEMGAAEISARLTPLHE
jgi:DNA-binding IclR family transcriptional regulator